MPLEKGTNKTNVVGCHKLSVCKKKKNASANSIKAKCNKMRCACI